MRKRAESSSSLLADTSPASPLARVEEIALFLRGKREQLPSNPSLSGGSLGAFLFFYAHTQLSGTDTYAGDAEELLLDALPKALAGPAGRPLYCRELSELGGLIRYLQGREYLDGSFDQVLERVDERLLLALPSLQAVDNFDPFLGYLPVATYFLGRGQASAAASEAVAACVDTLLNSYIQTRVGGYWLTKFKGKAQIYTGWSHGMAAILLFLARVLEERTGYREEELRAALAGASAFLLELADEQAGTIFPDIVGLASPRGSLNLCYGDLGISHSLLASGRTLGDESLQKQALDFLEQAASRRNPLACRVQDASLIYGASGTALFFRQLYLVTGTACFQEAASFWYGQSHALSQHAGQVAGFLGSYNQGNPDANQSLFEGVPGYGLAIMEMEWGSIGLLKLIGY